MRQDGSSGQPAIRGPKIPEALRKQLQAQLDARVDADVAQTKELRGEAIGLLTKFVGETPREAREMPEALVRLGELQWENARDGFVDRFKEWEKRPVDQRGPAPELDYRVPRDLFARVLRDYPWFDQYDLALYVDGFLAYEQGKEDEARERFERILRDYPQSRFVPDAHMAKAEAIFNGKFDYAGALAEYEKVLSYKDQIDPALYGLALFKSAWCYWRLGNNDEAARRFVGVFEATDAGGGGKTANAAQRKQLDELQGEALRYIVEVFTEDEKNTAQDLYNFLTKIGGERFSGKIVRALAEQYYDQAHYERGIEAYELLLKLEPTSRDAGRVGAADRGGVRGASRTTRTLKATFERAIAAVHRRRPVVAHAGRRGERGRDDRRDREGAPRGRDGAPRAARRRTRRAAPSSRARRASTTSTSRSSRRSRRRTRCTSTSPRSTSSASTRTSTRRRTTWPRPRRSPPGETSGPLATMRHDALYNALVALSREMDVKSPPGSRGRVEGRRERVVREGGRQVQPRRSTSTRSSTRTTPSCRRCSTARAATTSTPATTTRR